MPMQNIELPRASRRSRWHLILSEFVLLLGVAFILYGFTVCALSYLPTESERGEDPNQNKREPAFRSNHLRRATLIHR